MKDSSGYKCLLNYLSSVLISSIKSALNKSSLFQDLVTSQQILHDAVIEQSSVMLMLPLKIENTLDILCWEERKLQIKFNLVR